MAIQAIILIVALIAFALLSVKYNNALNEVRESEDITRDLGNTLSKLQVSSSGDARG